MQLHLSDVQESDFQTCYNYQADEDEVNSDDDDGIDERAIDVLVQLESVGHYIVMQSKQKFLIPDSQVSTHP